MNKEKKPKQTRSFEEVEQEMKTRGFAYIGHESLTTVKAGSDFRLITIPFQTRKEIIARYSGPRKFKIKLVDDPMREETVWVFIKVED
jgi:hypothetical protein